jgi:hypothetical protein
LSGMRRLWIWFYLVVLMAAAGPASASTGNVIKVLPEFLDLKGRNSLSPSLYERDAYQVILREHPDQRSGIRFYVHWKTKGAPWAPLKLRLELRGSAEGNLPKRLTLDQALLNPGGLFGRWTGVTLNGEDYKKFGAVVAWRVTLWEGETLLGEQRSFLW